MMPLNLRTVLMAHLFRPPARKLSKKVSYYIVIYEDIKKIFF